MGQLRKRGNVWWLRYYRDGKRHEESSGSDKKGVALDLLKIREGDVAKGIPVSAKSGRFRFDAAVADVVTDYRINGRSTVDAVERRIRLHLTPYFGGRRMAAIDATAVRSYIAHRQADRTLENGTVVPGASNAEINRELAILKRAFRLATQAGTLMFRPHIPLLAENNVRAGFFERDQFEGVRDALPAYWQPVMTFAYLTGWRVRSEVLGLTWAQVDTSEQVIRLEPGTTKNLEARTFPYGALPELVTLIETQEGVRETLKRQATICPWLFPDASGGRLPAFYDGIWQRACRAAGCPGKIPHDFRRTAVRNLVRAGVPEKIAMQLTGHKTRSVFDRYDIVNEDDLRTAVGRLASGTGTEKGQSRDRGRVKQFRRGRK